MAAPIFPPKPLQDLNPFGIKTTTEAQAFLLALQRATAAALGVFLIYRYGPFLKDRLPCLPTQDVSHLLILSSVGYCLSAPATNLGLGSCFLIKGSMNIFTSFKEKTVTSTAINVLMIATGYCVFHTYETKKFLLDIPYTPHLLDRTFVAIAHKYSVSFYDYFFNK